MPKGVEIGHMICYNEGDKKEGRYPPMAHSDNLRATYDTLTPIVENGILVGATIEKTADLSCAGVLTLLPTVREIAPSALADCHSLLVLDATASSLRQIGYNALAGCQNLHTVRLPRTLKRIGGQAFEGCERLAEIALEDTAITYIGARAFYDCHSLTALTLPASLEGIARDAFAYCKLLATVDFKERSRLSVIGSRAFYKCCSLQRIVLPASLRELRTEAFHACLLLSHVSFAEVYRLRTPGENVFLGCDSLSSLTIAADAAPFFKKLTRTLENDVHLTLVAPRRGGATVPARSFNGMQGFHTLTIDRSIARIGEGAFCHCPELKSLVIMGDITLEEDAFFSCRALQKATLGGNTAIGRHAFRNCTLLSSFSLNPALLHKEKEGAEEGDAAPVIRRKRKKSTTLESLGEGAFRGCSKLLTVTLACDVPRVIPARCFYGCSSLAEILFRSPVEAVEEEAFFGCQALHKAVLSSVERIGKHAFDGCRNLATLLETEPGEDKQDVLPPTVTEIGEDAFRGCDVLTTQQEGISYVGMWAVGYRSDVILKKEKTESTESDRPSAEALQRESLLTFFRDFFRNCFLAKLQEPCLAFQEAMRSSTAEFVRRRIAYHEERGSASTYEGFMTLITAELDTLLLPLLRETAERTLCTDATHGVPAILEQCIDDLLAQEAQAPTASAEQLEYLRDIRESLPVVCRCAAKQDTERGSAVLLHPLGVYHLGLALLNRFPGFKPDADMQGSEEIKAEKSLMDAEERVKKDLLDHVESRLMYYVTTSLDSPTHTLATTSLKNGTVGIADGAFRNLFGVARINIPSVRIIGERAFSSCRNLSTLVLPWGLERIGAWAFLSCHELHNLEIPTTVKKMGAHAFARCWSFETIRLPLFRYLLRRRYFDAQFLSSHGARFLLAWDEKKGKRKANKKGAHADLPPTTDEPATPLLP